MGAGFALNELGIEKKVLSANMADRSSNKFRPANARVCGEGNLLRYGGHLGLLPQTITVQ